MKSGFKLIVSLVLIAIMIICIANEVFATDTETKNLGIVSQREGTNLNKEGKEEQVTRYSYAFPSGIGQGAATNIWKIVEYDGTEYNYNNSIYCIKGGLGFTNTSSQTYKDPREYDISRDMKKISEIVDYKDVLPDYTSKVTETFEKNVITENGEDIEKVSIEYNPYNAVLWLADNMYLPKYEGIEIRKEIRDELLNNAFAHRKTINEKFNVDDLSITDDDIEVVQQLAIWYFTNSDDYKKEVLPTMYVAEYNSEEDSFPSKLSDYVYLKNVGDVIDYNDGESKEGQKRVDEMAILYRYLLVSAAENSLNYGFEDARGIAKIERAKIAKDKATTPTITTSGNNYVVGPFKISKTGTADYDLDYKVELIAINNKSVDGEEIKQELVNDNNATYYYIFKDLACTEEILNMKDAISNGEFYIKITDKSDIDDALQIMGATFKGLTIALNIDYGIISNKTNVTFMTSKDNYLSEQPVMIVDREIEKDSEVITISTEKLPKKFDLALRKYITKVNGVELTSTRIPKIDQTNLEQGTDTTATYKHKKDPVLVNTGDEVTYNITIFNEGEVDGKATKIVDQLPTGLKFLRIGNKTNCKYSYDEETNILILEDNLVTNIPAYSAGRVSARTIEIVCEVTAEKTDAEQVLTNVAWIMEAYNAEEDKIITNEKGTENDAADRDSEPATAPNVNKDNMEDYKGNSSNKDDLSDSTYFYKGEQDDDDFEKLILPAKEKTFDLALRKFITVIDGKTVEPSREPKVDVSKLKDGTASTATYTHPKNPITVSKGSIVKYVIRIYNESEIDGYATKVEDYLPQELEYLPNSELNKQYGWVLAADGRTITTEYLKDTVIKAYTGGDELDFKDLIVECKVKETAEQGKILTNIAQIAEDKNQTPDVPDRDSTPNNVDKPEDKDLPKYADNQEDDDDFEKVIIETKTFDLALRKFITAIDGKTVEPSREPKVDVSKLKDGTASTATYTHPKNPLIVKTGDLVEYTLRIYNEGETSGYAEIIKDHIPDGLKFAINNDTNLEYRWILSEDQKFIVTDYLSKGRDEDNLIKAYDGGDTLDYKDIKVVFEVVEPNTSDRILTNKAEIAEDKDEFGNDVYDRDSTPNEWNEGEDDQDYEPVKLQYFDLALKKFITKVEDENSNNKDIKTTTTTNVSREPQVNVDKLQTIGEDGNLITEAEYTFKQNPEKDPVIVANNNIVIYTIRVYNEGRMDGYAEEIRDDIPEGLIYLPENAINKEFGWKMYTEDGSETGDASKATYIKTDYLKDTLIKAFDNENKKLDYKDVQVAFKVTEENIPADRIIINHAQISEDSDDDVDSTPDKWKDGEDDQDIEKVRVPYFDLSLHKWVTQSVVTVDGKTTVTETGFKPNIGLTDQSGKEYRENTEAEPIAKVEVDKKKLSKTVVKFVYKIKVTNEGEIDGQAKEITDYIPEGLEFYEEDNKEYGWTKKDDKRVVTNALDGITLKAPVRDLEGKIITPGDSKVIEIVFRWKNGEDNLGLKTNIAEISKDYNDSDSKDIDSTPDDVINVDEYEKEQQDDDDFALVILSIKTGAKNVAYVTLTTIVLAILAIGAYTIKKYIL